MAAPPVSSQSSPHVEVRLLGPFEVYREGIRLPADTWQRRIGRLFKLLVTAPDRRRSRDDLVDILWPDSSPRTGTSNLRLLVHLLRQSLSDNEPVAEGEVGTPGVLSHGGWVALNPNWVWEVDLDRFEQLARSDERRCREEAASLYRGEPLADDRYDDWAVPLRERIHRTWRDLCLELARDYKGAGSPQRAVQALERILESDPLDEEALRELLSLLGQLGRRAEVLQRYRQFERRLDEELDLRPAPETFAVIDGLRGSEDLQSLPSVQGGRLDLSSQIVPVTPRYPFPSSRTLVGREDHLRRLRHAFFDDTDTAGDHEDLPGPRLLFIEAEAGMGKTHLLGEVARQARGQGFLTLAGGCYEQEGALAYGPIHDALLDYLRTQPQPVLDMQLGDLVPDLLLVVPEARGQVDSPAPRLNRVDEDERLRLFSTIARVFERISGDKPLLLLLDDLHWADDATLQLLHFLLRQNTLDRVSIVGAYRAEEVAEDALLARLASEMRETLSSRLLCLDPLAEADLAAILEDRLGGRCTERLVTVIHARSAGNPFFAVQMARLLHQEHRISAGGNGWELHAGADFDLPVAVHDAVARRLRRFDHAEREALTLAAVLGREFAYPALESMWRGTDDDLFAALDGAVDSHVLSESESGYVFRHPLLWEVVYQRVPAHRRPSLHRRAALALESVYGDYAQDHAAELAWHFLTAGDRGLALTYTLRAAGRAAAAFAHKEAERQYLTVLDLAHELRNDGAEQEAQEGLGGVLTKEGRFDRALELLERAARMRRRAGDLDGEARVVVQIGWVHFFKGWTDEGRTRIQSFLETAGEHLTFDRLVALHAVLSNLLLGMGEPEESLAIAERALELARSAGHDGFLAECEVSRGLLLLQLGRHDEALSALLSAVPSAEAAGDLHSLVRAFINSSLVYQQQGRFATARLQAERGLEIARRQEHALPITAHTDALAGLAFQTGDWEEARQLWEQAIPMARSLGPSRVSANPLFGVGLLSLRQGRTDDARQYLAECIALAEPAGLGDVARAVRVALAELELAHGRPKTALERVVAVSEEIRERIYHDYYLLTVLALAQLALEDVAQAEDAVKRGLERATARGERPGLTEMLWLQGKILAREGRWPEAERALHEAAAVARELPYPFLQAQVLAELGTGDLEREQWRRGREHLKAALTIYERLQATPYVEQTRQTLQRLTPHPAQLSR